MARFKSDASYQEQGEKAQVGSTDGRRAIRIGNDECPLDYHVETRQILNPLNPYEVHGSEESLARAIARVVAEDKHADGKKGGK